MAKRAEERARAARLKAEQDKPPPTEVDDSKRKVNRRSGAARAGWAAAEAAESAGDAEAAAAARAEAEKLEAEAQAIEDAEMGIHIPRGRDAREVGYATGFVSDLVGMPGRSTNSNRVRDLLVWEVEDLEARDQETTTLETTTLETTEAQQQVPSSASSSSSSSSAAPASGASSVSQGVLVPGSAGVSVAAVPFRSSVSAEWDPRSYRFLPPSWTRAIPAAGRPSARSEAASEALLMCE
jgi:hypothetical protein